MLAKQGRLKACFVSLALHLGDSTIQLMDEVYRLLARCARIDCTGAQRAQIAQCAEAVQDWTSLSSLAEQHGMAPLLYMHLKAADVHPPSEWRNLQALYLRHRLASDVRERVLAEVLDAFAGVGIQVFVLKGAALAYLLYNDPTSRPMRDVDLLVNKEDVVEAQRLLDKVGFSAPVSDAADLPDRHVGAARDEDGFIITLEVHHNLFSAEDVPLSMTVGNLISPSLSFVLGETGQVAHTLGYEDMLWHLCQHMRLSSGVFGANRLIWIADIVGFAERYVLDVDWDLVHLHYPQVINTLSLLHFLLPLSETLVQRAAIDFGRAPSGIGADFVGWPRFSIVQQRDKGAWGIVRDTWFPAKWWLRLYYELGSTQPVFTTRWLRHPWHICGWVMHLLRQRVNDIISKLFSKYRDT